jgi:ribonucleotide reductase beta subunit family protein with ferritin-like domain
MSKSKGPDKNTIDTQQPTDGLSVKLPIRSIVDGCDEENAKKLVTELIKKYGSQKIVKIIDDIEEEKNKDEPLLDIRNKKFTAFPIKYQDLWNRYREQQACSWKAEEIDFSNDYGDFMALSNDEKYFIEMILAFFAASDGIVNFNLSERFTKEIQVTEAQFAYAFQMMMENIHSHTYSLMLDNIVRDKDRKDFLFNAIKNVPSVKMMADWAFKWIDSSESFAHRVVAFAIVEAIFFSGTFAAIFWIKKYKNNESSGKKFMNGLISSNKLIARDEGLHVKFACDLYKHVNNKLTIKEVNEIVREGVQVAQGFMKDALPVKLIGMNEELMTDYIEYIADRLLNMLGYRKIYKKKSPFKFMESIGLNDKTNFFESRATEYQDSNVMSKVIDKSSISVKDDF